MTCHIVITIVNDIIICWQFMILQTRNMLQLSLGSVLCCKNSMFMVCLGLGIKTTWLGKDHV